MAICYIVGAGEDCGVDFVPQTGDLVIAADGGYRLLRETGIIPDLVVGDFDSLGAAPEGETVITLPVVKDVTDTWAAIELGKDRGFRAFRLYGCTGGRMDHTLANVQTLASLAEQGMQGWLVSATQEITAISGKTVSFAAGRSGTVSVFAHTECCTGVTIRGLQYELENAELTNRFPLGVSNAFVGRTAEISVAEGILVLVYPRTKNV